MRTIQLTISFVSLLFLLNSCEKENKQTGMDFLQNEWKVQSVNKHLDPQDYYHREDAYILKFFNDSIFDLNTSINYAEGKYQIVSKGHIVINNYSERSLVYGAPTRQRKFDEQLLSAFNGVMTYSYTKNKLIFRGDKNKEIVFVKQSKN